MELRAHLSSISAINEQLQAEASTLMNFHRLAEAHGPEAAEKLLLQQMRSQTEQQTTQIKELQRLLSSKEAHTAALEREVTVCRQALASVGAFLRNVPLENPPEAAAQPRAKTESRSTQTEAPIAPTEPDSDSQTAPEGSESTGGPQGPPEAALGPLGPSAGGGAPEPAEEKGPQQPHGGLPAPAAPIEDQGAPLGASGPVMRFTVGPSTGYEHKKDDAVDTAVAALSNARINKVLFTRICKGVYLYGHLAVAMRLSTSGELKVSYEGKDYSAKEFIHNFEEEEFRYLKERQKESGRAVSLEVCPHGAPSPSQGPPRAQAKQARLRSVKSKGDPGAPDSKRGPPRRRSVAGAAAVGLAPEGPLDGRPRRSRSSSSSSSSRARSSASTLPSCRLLPCSSLPLSHGVGCWGPQERGSSFVFQDTVFNMRRTAGPLCCSGRSPKSAAAPRAAAAPKAAAAAAKPAAAKPTAAAKPRLAAAASFSLPSSASLPSAGPRSTGPKQRLRAPSAAAEQLTRPGRACQCSSGAAAKLGQPAAQPKLRQGPRAPTRLYSPL
ncbi:hypothetical protein, conserved [Eimeria tenella]|uniref:Uncharacterized protein n=1 Tax=Eimeria tenella TaxID=5802 RepID=U6L8V0_EIMTE|nr:hypothetical protein, conserved [Eimeria tenella]CDJ44959.1 hypothetical protein, conserved [Eimeria tenella]|eukprot:XP_013235706.1 hypothetical protein, conserved [Eimeria tenella]